MEIDRYNRLKRKLDQEKIEQAKAEGARDELLKKLKELWDVDSMEEAEVALASLRDKEAKSEELFQKALDEFEEKWKNDERVG